MNVNSAVSDGGAGEEGAFEEGSSRWGARETGNTEEAVLLDERPERWGWESPRPSFDEQNYRYHIYAMFFPSLGSSPPALFRWLDDAVTLVESQKTFSQAERLAEKIAAALLTMDHAQIEALQNAQASRRQGFADIVSALGTLDIGTELPAVMRLLQSYIDGPDTRLADAATDARDLLIFKAE